jgi:hypothetical protein
MEAILGALAALALALIGVTLFRAGRGAPPRRHTVAIAYPAPPREQPSGGALLEALDDSLTPTTQQMN